MLYFVIYVIAALAAFGLRHSPRDSRSLYPVLIAFFFVVTAFRFEVGCDWIGYHNQFRYAALENQDTFFGTHDPLWWALIRQVRDFGLSYPWLNVLSAAIFFAGVHVLAKRQPDRLAFLVLLWPILIINITMSGIRQAAATGILCIAYTAFAERRVLKFSLLVLLASSFHSSAMVFLLLVPLVQGEYSRARLVLAALLAIPGGLFLMSTEAADVAVSRYIESGIDAAGAAARVGLISLSGLFFLGILRRPWQATKAADYKLLHIGSLAMIGLAALLPLSTVIADRLAYYFVPLQAIMFARIPFLPMGRSNKNLYAAIPYVVLGLVLLVWTLLSQHFKQCYLPYQTWLFGMPESSMGL